MGYRSDVAIAIYGPEEIMVPFIAANRMLDNSPLVTDKEYVDCYTFSTRTAVGGEMQKAYMINTKFESVKWYPNYPDVMSWTKLIADAQQVEGLNTEFIRVGEEDADVETEYHGEHCQYYLRVEHLISNDTPQPDDT